MPSSGWFFDNANRAYPLATPGPAILRDGDGTDHALPHATIVDFTAIYTGPGDGPGTVYLKTIARAGTTLTVTIAGDHPDAAGVVLTFFRDVAAPDWLGAAAVATGDDGCGPRELWSGTLVTGRLATLAAAIADGAVWTGTPATAPLEPTTTQITGNRVVQAISVGNFPRIPTAPPDGCGPIPSTPTDLVVVATCRNGALTLAPGHNAELYQADALNLIRLHGRHGAGLGPVLATVPLGPGDVDDGPWCGAVVRRINGVSGAHQRLNAGPGVRIGPDPANPSIVRIDLDRHDLSGG